MSTDSKRGAETLSTDSKTTVKRGKRAQAIAEFLETRDNEDPAAAVMANRKAAKEALAAVQAIKTLQAIVPGWSRKERRQLATALRLRGAGYTKNTEPVQ